MSTWYRDGVKGTLVLQAAEGLRKVKRLFAQNGEDLYITSMNDGVHLPESFHYTNRAWDQRKGSFSIDDMRNCLGPDFDVCNGKGYYHCEYQPGDE